MSLSKPHLVGLNHIALEVGDVEDALRFYESIFTFKLRGSHKDEQARIDMAFIDLGDQFLALSGGRTSPRIQGGISVLWWMTETR